MQNIWILGMVSIGINTDGAHNPKTNRKSKKVIFYL